MVEAGLTPAQVLRAATVHGAAALGLERELGDVAVGRRADLVLLTADPHASVDNLARARLVIRAGRAYDPAELMASIRPAVRLCRTRPVEPWVRRGADEVGGVPRRNRPAERECAKP